jgi:multiple sugar transport system permease protein/putative aldouronate transport system permease protein
MILQKSDAQSELQRMAGGSEELLKNLNTEGITSAIIVISIIPILFIYPYLQKHFTKGIMVGAIKG